MILHYWFIHQTDWQSVQMTVDDSSLLRAAAI